MAHVAVKEVENPRNPPLVRWKNNKRVGLGLISDWFGLI